QQVSGRTKELSEANHRLQTEIAERRRAEQARQHLLERIVTIQTDERRRISRELHDQIGQQVAALSLRLGTLQSEMTNQDGLKACQAMLDGLGRQLHDLAVAVRPAGLEELGLVPALSNHGEEWAAQHRIALDFHQRGLQRARLSPAMEDVLYWIA